MILIGDGKTFRRKDTPEGFPETNCCSELSHSTLFVAFFGGYSTEEGFLKRGYKNLPQKMPHAIISVLTVKLFLVSKTLPITT